LWGNIGAHGFTARIHINTITTTGNEILNLLNNGYLIQQDKSLEGHIVIKPTKKNEKPFIFNYEGAKGPRLELNYER
jgi:hypothetical protein